MRREEREDGEGWKMDMAHQLRRPWCSKAGSALRAHGCDAAPRRGCRRGRCWCRIWGRAGGKWFGLGGFARGTCGDGGLAQGFWREWWWWRKVRRRNGSTCSVESVEWSAPDGLRAEKREEITWRCRVSAGGAEVYYRCKL
jgi:hypothetical protein